MANSRKFLHINLEYLRTISDGNEAFEKAMIELYIKLTPKELDKMHAGLATNDFSVLQNGAHKLVSSVGLIGADSMKERLAEIEILALTKTDFERITVLLHEISALHVKVASELQQLLQTRT